MGGPVFIDIEDSEMVASLRLDNNIVFVAQRDDDENGIEFLERYRIDNDKLITKQLGTWTRAQGLNLTDTPVSERRDDLMGISLTNGVLRWVPIIDYDKDEAGRQLMSQ